MGTRLDPSLRVSGGFRAREGYQNVSPNDPPSRMYVPNSRWTWTFVVVSTVQAILTLALES